MTSAAVDEVAVDDQRDADDARCAASTPCSSVAGAAADPALEPSTTRRSGACTSAASSVQRRSTWAWPEAGAQVVAGGDALLQSRRRGRSRPPPRRPCAAEIWGSSGGRRPGGEPGQREQEERRPPGRARDHPQRAGGEDGADACQTLWRSSVPTSWVSSSIRSSTSPTACSVSAESGWACAASSRSARSRPSARSTTPAHIVRPTVSSSGGADDAQGQQPDQARAGVLGQPAGDHRAERRPDRAEQRAGERDDGDRRPQPPPVDRHASGAARGGVAVRRARLCRTRSVVVTVLRRYVRTADTVPRFPGTRVSAGRPGPRRAPRRRPGRGTRSPRRRSACGHDVERAQQLGRHPPGAEPDRDCRHGDERRTVTARASARVNSALVGVCGQQRLNGPLARRRARRGARRRRPSRAARSSGCTAAVAQPRAEAEPEQQAQLPQRLRSRSITGAVRSTHTRAPASMAGSAAACQSRVTSVMQACAAAVGGLGDRLVAVVAVPADAVAGQERRLAASRRDRLGEDAAVVVTRLSRSLRAHRLRVRVAGGRGCRRG